MPQICRAQQRLDSSKNQQELQVAMLIIALVLILPLIDFFKYPPQGFLVS